jgi:hypothetical protein
MLVYQRDVTGFMGLKERFMKGTSSRKGEKD